MRKLLALLAVLGLGSQALADVSHSADMRVIYNNTSNFDYDDSAGNGDANADWYHRLRLGLDFNKGEAISGHLKLVHASAWGETTKGTNDQYPDGSAYADENHLFVNEAYMTWMANDSLSIKLGRGTFTMANGKVVASNEWQQLQKAFDGALVSWDQEWGRVNLFNVVGYDNLSDTASVEGTFYGVSVDVKALPEFFNMANIHYIVTDADSALTNEQTNRIGLSVGGDQMGIDYGFTYAMYTGTDTAAETDVDANMMELEVGYSMPDMMNFRVGLLYHTDTGDDTGSADTDEAYDGFHYDTHNNAGLMDIVTWGNVTYTKLGVSFEPMEMLGVGLDYYMFEETEEAGADAEIGSEIDLVVTKKYSDNMSIEFRYGQFSPGEDLGEDNAEQVMLTFNAGF